MHDVETLALWAGLLTGVVSVVLAVVSIIFTRSVEKRSSEINTHMIQTLQKIESAVERSTNDTAGLIKVAWERMLPSVGGSVLDKHGHDADVRSHETASEIASGVAAELRSELAGMTDIQPLAADLNKALSRLERTIEAQLEAAPMRQSRAGQAILVNVLESLSPGAVALLAELTRGGHLTTDQLKHLYTGPLATEISELRDRAFVIPLAGRNADGSEIPVYWLPPKTSRDVRALIRLVDKPPAGVIEQTRQELERIGYRRRGQSE